MREAWPKGGWQIVVAVLGAAMVCWMIIAWFEVTSDIMRVNIQQVAISGKKVGQFDRFLRIQINVPDSPRCVRRTDWSISDEDGGDRIYVPIGTSLNSRSFAGAVATPTIVLPLPWQIGPGPHMLYTRLMVTCSYLGGFLNQVHSFGLPPREIDVPE